MALLSKVYGVEVYSSEELLEKMVDYLGFFLAELSKYNLDNRTEYRQYLAVRTLIKNTGVVVD